MFRKVLECIVSRNFQIAGTSRSSYSWRFYERTKNFSWRCRYSRTGSRKSYEPKLLFALAASFSFKDFGISDERFKKAEKAVDEFDARDDEQRGWEVLREEKDFRALRRRLAGDRELYEYKCAGTYWDISPRSFLDAQNDINYRTEWDGNIISLELLDENEEHELLRWVSKFPYPLHAREYVYVRRTWISDDKKVVVIESEVVPEEVVPSSPKTKNVRVSTYTSRMAIRSHDDWNEHGVDYILTYSDNPEANIPRYIYNWMVNQGGPYFLKQVHKAALEIEKSGKEIRSVLERLCPSKIDETRLQVPEVSDEVEEVMEEEELDENDEKKEEGVVDKIQMIMPGLRNIKSKTFQNSVPESSLLS